MPEFPRSHLVPLQELAARVVDVRAVNTPSETVARDLLAGFYDVCMRSGLEKVLVDLAKVYPPLDLDDRTALADHPELLRALAEKVNLDDGGPRNAKPRQMAEAVIASLGLTLADEPDRSITLSDVVRLDVMAALASVIDVELGVPQIRASFIAKGRAMCEAHYHSAFDKITSNLDDTGTRMLKQPKISLDAVQAVERVMTEARAAVISRAANAGIDRAVKIIAAANADAAARIDRPISHALTPRQVAVRRVTDPRASKAPAAVTRLLTDGLAELARLKWATAEKPVRPYSASQTFAMGDLVEHPKFGRGTVVGSGAKSVEIEFPDGKRSLAHVPTRK